VRRPALFALAARARDPELAHRLRLVVLWILWAEAVAAGGRSDARLPHFGRLAPARRAGRPRRARGSFPGRRPRG
jgi:hypothetical protein